jgi:group I intron endonuclease
MIFDYNGFSQKGGVYRLLNLVNGRSYFGSCRRFKERWSEHIRLLRIGKHRNLFLQHDFRKSGEQAFRFLILDVVEGDKTKRLAIEQQYLDCNYDNQNTCYNLDRYAHSREGSKARNPQAT